MIKLLFNFIVAIIATLIIFLVLVPLEFLFVINNRKPEFINRFGDWIVDAMYKE